MAGSDPDLVRFTKRDHGCCTELYELREPLSRAVLYNASRTVPRVPFGAPCMTLAGLGEKRVFTVQRTLDQIPTNVPTNVLYTWMWMCNVWESQRVETRHSEGTELGFCARARYRRRGRAENWGQCQGLQTFQGVASPLAPIACQRRHLPENGTL